MIGPCVLNKVRMLLFTLATLAMLLSISVLVYHRAYGGAAHAAPLLEHTVLHNSPPGPQSEHSVEAVTGTLTLEPISRFGGAAQTIAVSGTTALLGEGTTLVGLDVSNPAQPAVLARLPLPAEVREIQVRAQTVYVLVAGAQLLIFDMHERVAPVLVGGYTFPDGAYHFDVEDHLAFVARYSELLIIDVSVPISPTLVGSYQQPAVWDVDVVGQRAYLTHPSMGLAILDVSNPISPTLLGRYEQQESAEASKQVRVDGNYAIIIAQHLEIIDISNPISPTLTGSLYNAPNSFYELEVAHGLAVVASSYAHAGWEHSAVGLLDMRDPTKPTYIPFPYGNTLSATAMVLDGMRLFVTDTYCGLQIFDIGAPGGPAFLGSYELTNSVRALQVLDHQVVVANVGGLHVLDVSNPLSPTLTGRFPMSIALANTGMDVQVAGSLAYLVWSPYPVGAFDIIDISTPTTPTLTGIYTDEHFLTYYASSVVIDGRAYLAASRSGLTILDVHHPEAPSLLGNYDLPGTGSAEHVQVWKDLAFVADGEAGLQIVQVSNPVTPTQIGHYDTAGYAFRLQVRAPLVYIAAGEEGLQIVDVRDPSAPALVGGYDTPKAATDVQIVGTQAYVAAGQAIYVLDVTNPAHVVLAGVSSLPSSADRVAVEGDWVYVGTRDGSIHVLRVRASQARTIYLPTLDK